jgi:transposase InsO family protein
MNKYQQRGYIFTTVMEHFPMKPVILMSKYERWRKMAKARGLSREAAKRLDWMVYYQTTAGQNARLTCRHYGIAPKTFYKWFDRFDETDLGALEDRSKAPKHTRQKEYTGEQYRRVVELRKQYLRYGKMKLLRLYQLKYPDDRKITSWKIQCIIEKANIYYRPQKQDRINRKRQLSQKRKKITDLKMKKIKGFLLCLDTVTLYWMGRKRYIITAIDKWTKVAFARMYTAHSSYNARDFLYRLHYLLGGKIENVQTDNGSEFKKYFNQGCEKLCLTHYYSRVKTPKDNPDNERFNRTLQEEFIDMGNMTDDTELFNRKLTEWLIHYNFGRPHQTLDYMPPINFVYKYHNVLPMYPSSTKD